MIVAALYLLPMIPQKRHHVDKMATKLCSGPVDNERTLVLGARMCSLLTNIYAPSPEEITTSERLVLSRIRY